MLKSLNQYYLEQFSSLSLDLFCPPYDNEKIRNELRKIFFNSPFFKEMNITDTWKTYWDFAQFIGESSRLYIAFTLENKGIKFVLFENISGSSFSGKHEELLINFNEFWLDHSVLHQKIVSIFSKGLMFANRANYSDKY